MSYFNSCFAHILLLFGGTGRYILFLLSSYPLGLFLPVCSTAQNYSALELHASAEWNDISNNSQVPNDFRDMHSCFKPKFTIEWKDCD